MTPKLQVSSAKEPLIIRLFCGKWPRKIRHPMHLCHLVLYDSCIRVPWLFWMWDLTLLHVWHGSFTCVPWLFNLCATQLSPVKNTISWKKKKFRRKKYLPNAVHWATHCEGVLSHVWKNHFNTFCFVRNALGFAEFWTKHNVLIWFFHMCDSTPSQCVAVCCSVLQCVAVFVAMCCSVTVLLHISTNVT